MNIWSTWEGESHAIFSSIPNLLEGTSPNQMEMKVAVGWTIHFQTSGCSQKSLGKPAKSTRDTRHSDHGPRNLARESSTSGVTSTKHHDDDDDDAQRRWRWHVCHDFMWFWGCICKLLCPMFSTTIQCKEVANSTYWPTAVPHLFRQVAQVSSQKSFDPSTTGRNERVVSGNIEFLLSRA